jgi:Holliday junction resolvase RusA-like endonuclease
VRCTIDIYLPIPKALSKKKAAAAMAGELRPITRPDTSNYVKSAEDSLNGIVFRDDSQIVELIARKWYSDRPRLEIEVSTLEAAAPTIRLSARVKQNAGR